jgi:hypothetical protein
VNFFNFSLKQKDEANREERQKRKEREMAKLQRDLEDKEIKRKKIEAFLLKEGSMNIRGDEDKRTTQKEYIRMVETSLEEEKDLREKIGRLEKDIQSEPHNQNDVRHLEIAKEIVRLNQHSVNILRSRINKYYIKYIY